MRYCGIEKRLSHQSHKLKIAGSIPAPATKFNINKRYNIKEYSEMLHGVKPKRRSKYGAIKTIIDGILFDSKKEANRYVVLKKQEKEGYIYDLKLQPEWKFPGVLTEKGRTYKYRADFSYIDRASGKLITEDVKGIRTEIYKLKRALMKYFHGITIKEV